MYYSSLCLYVRPSIHVSVCSSVLLAVLTLVRPSVCLSVVCWSICLSARRFVCPLSVYLDVYLSVIRPVCLSHHLFVFLSVCLSVFYLFVHLSVSLSVAPSPSPAFFLQLYDVIKAQRSSLFIFVALENKNTTHFNQKWIWSILLSETQGNNRNKFLRSSLFLTSFSNFGKFIFQEFKTFQLFIPNVKKI